MWLVFLALYYIVPVVLFFAGVYTLIKVIKFALR